MDVPVPVDEPAADPPQRPAPVEDTTPTAHAVAEPTLAEIQAEVTALGRRVDSLAGSFDASVRAAVAEEVHRVAGELQHTVAALGRVLVRDLGRLNQILTQHRDAILSELQGSRKEPRATAEVPPAAEPGAAPPGGAGADSGRTEPDEPPADNEKGRHWRRRKA